jgi:transposase-like protein
MSNEISTNPIDFITDQQCIDFFFRKKWPNGFFCPRCDYSDAYIVKSRRLPLFECLSCGHQTSLTVGTILEGTRTDLKKWYTAIMLISDLSRGISALALSRIISVTYKTAWLMLHKIRHAMSHHDNSYQLTGIIRVNSAFYGKPHNPTVCRHPKETPVFVGASMDEHDQPTSLKIKIVAASDMKEHLFLKRAAQSFSEKCLDPNSHFVEIITGRFVPLSQKKVIPYFRQSSAWLRDTFHGIGPKHLQKYFDEFCCRYNLARSHPCVSESLTHICTSTRTITYRTLVDKLRPC